MNRTVTPSVLAERIQQKTGIDKETAKNFSFAFFDLVKSQLKKEPVFVIQKFGRFRKIFVEASLKRNPMTNQMVEIPAHYKIRFTPSKSLASRLNAKYAHLKAKALKLKKTASRQFCEKEHTPEQLLTQNMQELCESTKPEKKHGRLAAGVAAVLLILLCSLMLLAIKLVGLPDFFNSKKKTNGNTDGFSGKNPALEKLEKVKEEENLAETEKHDMLLSSSEKSVQKYGSLFVNLKQSEDSRLMPVSEISSAVVTVSGNDMLPVEQNVLVSDGKGYFAIEQIPVGKNRIISVQALNNGVKIDGIVISALKDIVAGENVIETINAQTSVRAKVYKALFDSGVNISTLSSEQEALIDSAIPSIKTWFIDSSKIASDYISGTLQDSSKYVLSPATLNINVKGSKDCTVQVTDPVSKASSQIASDNENVTISDVVPGKWNIYVLDGS